MAQNDLLEADTAQDHKHMCGGDEQGVPRCPPSPPPLEDWWHPNFVLRNDDCSKGKWDERLLLETVFACISCSIALHTQRSPCAPV